MIVENLTRAKALLSALVNAALDGEDVMISKDGVPVVKLVPVRPTLGGDPCRPIANLEVRVGPAAMEPLAGDAWGDWVDDGPA